MGRVRTSVVRQRVPRTRLPLRRLVLADPSVARRWLLVLGLALLTAGLVARSVADAEAARRAWGRTGTVLVVDRSRATGEDLAGAVVPVRWPRSLIPDGALTRLPAGARAATGAEPGTPVTAGLVADRTDPEAPRRVALPRGEVSLPLEVGDRVEVWATVDPSLAGGAPATRLVAAGAEVRSVRESAVVVAVDPDDLDDVAGAAAFATVTIVALGP